MTFSIYEELTGMQEATGLEIRKKLIDMGLGQIFDFAWFKHQESGAFKPIVLYTVYTYSWETKMVRIGADWQKTKIRIAQRVELPQYLYDDVVHLKSKELAECFQEFLHLYNDNIDYVHLTSLKELYQQVMSQSIRYQPDETGQNDLPEKFKNIKRAGEIIEEIKQLESEQTAKYRVLQGAKSDFKYDQTEHGNPLKVENSTFIRG